MHMVPGMANTLVRGAGLMSTPLHIDQPDHSGPCTHSYPDFQPGSASTFCALGFYCPEGSGEPIPCPPHTLVANPGAQRKEDCGPCPPGQWCKAGEVLGLGDTGYSLDVCTCRGPGRPRLGRKVSVALTPQKPKPGNPALLATPALE